MKLHWYCLLLSFSVIITLSAQEPAERKVIEVLHAEVARSLQHNGQLINRLIGQVQLMHNGAVMMCDSAYLYPANRFEAFGHIIIIKDATKLYGDTLYYDGNVNLAQVRGKLIRLEDSSAVLRTYNLDYNTKENLAYFFGGGTLADTGNVLESEKGYYYSDLKLAKFHGAVEMHNDTYDVLSDSLHYYTNTELSIFLGPTSIWHQDGFLSCLNGWYDRPKDYFHFSKQAYVQSEVQEMWADSIFYERTIGKSDLFGNIQVLDTTKSLLVFGDEAHLLNESQQATVTRNPSIAYYGDEQQEKRDTVFLRADTLKFVTEKNPEFYAKDSLQADTLSMPKTDSLTWGALNMRKYDTLFYAEAYDTNVFMGDTLCIDAYKLLPDIELLEDKFYRYMGDSALLHSTLLKYIPSVGLGYMDTLSEDLRLRRIAVPALEAHPVYSGIYRLFANDTIKFEERRQIDSTWQHFLAYRSVRVFRNDGQAVCDSMIFFVNDSIAEMFHEPVLWNENYQITSEKMNFVSKNGELYRGEFLGSAFMTSQEDTANYNQVKSRDMFAYFRNNELYLMDVIAGVQTIFFMEEDSVIVNINLAESTNMKIYVKNRKISRIKYLDHPKIDMFPLDEVPFEKQRLRGFSWLGDIRPKTRYDVCDRLIRSSRRLETAGSKRPEFPITKKIDAIK
jgi:hypothetical protein